MQTILETILNKIKTYEKTSETSWIDFVKENFAVDNIKLNEGDSFTDSRTGLTIKVGYLQ